MKQKAKIIKKPIAGFSRYEVDNFGNVYSNTNWHKGKKLKLYVHPDGYLQVTLYKGGKMSTKRVHRLVLKAFVPNPKNKPECNHINGIKDDNRVKNLCWATPLENTHHAIETGLRNNAGVDNYKAKLRVINIKYIRGQAQEFKELLDKKALAKKYGVHVETIRNVVGRRTYKNIPPISQNGQLKLNVNFKSKTKKMKNSKQRNKTTIERATLRASQLSDADIREVRFTYARNPVKSTLKSLSGRFSVDATEVRMIVDKKTRSEVENYPQYSLNL